MPRGVQGMSGCGTQSYDAVDKYDDPSKVGLDDPGDFFQP